MKKNIYLVEDNDDIRELVSYLFESEGYLVRSFATATEFKVGLGNIMPDIFLLDVMLPDGNGMHICNQLKTTDASKNIPVVLMSANTNMTYIGEESLADDFISKPFDIDELVKRVNLLLES